MHFDLQVTLLACCLFGRKSIAQRRVKTASVKMANTAIIQFFVRDK